MTQQPVKRSSGTELAPWTGFSPLRELRALEERLEKLFGDVFPRFGALSPRWAEAPEISGWEPAVEIYDNDKEFVLKAELPGISEKDVYVSMDEGVLTITGERKEEKEITISVISHPWGSKEGMLLPPGIKPLARPRKRGNSRRVLGSAPVACAT